MYVMNTGMQVAPKHLQNKPSSAFVLCQKLMRCLGMVSCACSLSDTFIHSSHADIVTKGCLLAVNKRDLYNRGQASGYPRQTAGSWNSATSQQYYASPRARSGWANFRYQQQKRKQAGLYKVESPAESLMVPCQLLLCSVG